MDAGLGPIAAFHEERLRWLADHPAMDVGISLVVLTLVRGSLMRPA